MKILLFLFALYVQSIYCDNDEKPSYQKPSVGDTAYLSEAFHNQEEFKSRWIMSEAKKDGVEDSIAKYDGVWKIAEPKENPLKGDHGLVLSSQAKHAAVSASLDKPFKFEDKPLIVQYEVRFQNKHECGGAYIKLVADSPSLNLAEFTDKTEYSIMFGPDRCGNDNKLHFIFQHENPITHKMEEKHAKKPSKDFGNIFEDGKTHLVTLVVEPDNTYKILLDRKELSSGSLLADMEPPVNPPKMIDDPEDSKPENWDEREKIKDPAAVKPDDWDEDAPMMIEDPNAQKPSGWLDDESELVPDPNAVRPADWDDEEDGEWEAPQIDNPKCKAVGCGEWKRPSIKNANYKGKWSAPLIANPDYKGIWAPRKIENPNFFEDTNPFAMKSISAVGFELWSMQSDILFDNLIIADDQSIVDQWTVQSWEMKRKQEKSSDSSVTGMWENFMEATEEKPWLWIVVIACIFVPIVLLVYFCTSSSKSEEVSRRKKTDEPTPDDAPVEEEQHESQTEGEEGAASTEESDDKAATEDEGEVEVEAQKTDGEAETEEPKVEEVAEDSPKTDKEEDSQVLQDKEEDSQEEGDEKTEEAASNTADEAGEASPSPRTRSKRRARKD